MKRALGVCLLVALGCGGESIRYRSEGGAGDGGSAGTGGTSAGTATAAVGGSDNGGGGGGGGGGGSGGGGSGSGATGGDAASAGVEECADTRFDAKNCGACGHVCPESCAYGRCVVTIAEELSNAGCVAADETSVYWATADLDAQIGTVWRAPLVGGTREIVATGMKPLWPCQLLVKDTNAFVTSEVDAQVLQISIAGAKILSLALGDTAPKRIAVVGDNVYFAESYGAVRRVPIGGGELATLAEEGGGLQGFAVDDSSAFWTTRDGTPLTGRVLTVPLAGGKVQVLATDQPTGAGMAVDERYVYWTSYNVGEVRRMPKAGGDVETLVKDVALAGVLELDASTLYLAALGGPYLVPKTGGVADPFAIAANVHDIELTRASIFLATGREILRVAR